MRFLGSLHVVLLAGFFISAACNFVFPLLTLFLVDKGFSRGQSAIAMSLSMLCSGLILPMVGSALDSGRYRAVLTTCFLGTVFGVGTLVLTDSNHMTSWLTLAGCLVFIVSTATLFSAARRCTEGLVAHEFLGRAAAIQYFVENTALGTAALLAFYLAEKYSSIILFADVFTSLIFVVILFYVYSRLEKKDKTPSPTLAYFKSGLTFIVGDPLLFVGVSFLLVGIFAHLSALPLLYSRLSATPKSHTALMNIVNTSIVALVSLAIGRGYLKIGFQKSLFVAAVLIAAGHVGAPFLVSDSGVVVTAMLWSLGEALLYPAITECIVGSFPQHQAGLGVGVKDFTIRFGLFLSPLVSSGLQQIDVKAFGIAYAGLPIVGSFLLYFRFRSRLRKSLNLQKAKLSGTSPHS